MIKSTEIEITKEERKEIIAILKTALVELSEYKYSINLTTHMFYNYFRNKDLFCGIKNIKRENKDIFKDPYNWRSSSYYQGYNNGQFLLKPYLSKIEKILDNDRYNNLVTNFSHELV